MEPVDDLTRVSRLEQQLLDPVVRRSPDAVAQFLADDFIEFGRSGRVFDKRDTILGLAAAQDEPPARLDAYGFEPKRLSDTLVLLTYRTTRIDDDGCESHALRSSIWALTDGRWRMVFHQGTPTSSGRPMSRALASERQDGL